MELKKCTKCGEEKPLTVEYFNIRKDRKSGFLPHCKLCVYKRNKDSYNANKEKRLEQARDYYKLNKKECLDRRKYYVEANKDKLLEKQKAYRDKNKEKTNKSSRACTERRKKQDPVFRATINLRGRIRDALKGRNKSATTLELLGCSIEHFRNHIESQFKYGISWDNYGSVWHIDHKRPFASFNNLSDPEQQREACHYTNLQPLFAEENLKKHAKWTG